MKSGRPGNRAPAFKDWLRRRLSPGGESGAERPPTRFSWTLTAKCNFNCPHCCIPIEWRTKHPGRVFSVDECCRAWENIHALRGSCLIEMSGGEPRIYPHFLEIVRRLSRWHSIGISTNLSFPAKRFIEEIDPRRVHLYPSFHPSEAKLDAFLGNLTLVQKAGFLTRALPVMVAYPPIFSQLEGHKEAFSRAGFQLHFLPFQGEYGGKRYPEAYTPEEKSYLRLCLTPELINYQLDLQSPRGKPCNAGYLYARIQNTGYAFRCAPEVERGLTQALGFFFSDDFRLLSQPASCLSAQCPCLNELNLLIKPTGAGGNRPPAAPAGGNAVQPGGTTGT